MKRTIFLCLALLSFTFSNAQDLNHLTFKGAPIDGPLESYVSHLKNNGFTLVEKENQVAILYGDFAGYKNCNLFVSTLKQLDIVNKISVKFENQDKWKNLSENYLDLKTMLTEKYGQPIEVIEKFDSGRAENDDSRIMFYIGTNKYKYFSKWETDKGTINLSIDNDSYGKFVKLEYIDKINSEILKSNAISDL